MLGLGLLAAVSTLSSCAGVTGAASQPQAQVQPPAPPAAPATASAVGITPAAPTFGNLITGQSSVQTITLTNTGNANLVITQVTGAGSGFTISGLTLPVTIGAGLTLGFNVQFAPTTTGAATTTLSIADNAPNSPQAMILTGTGVASNATLTANPGSYAFNNVVVGANSSEPFTLTNSGNTSVTLTSATASGPGFSVSGLSAGQIIRSGQSANFAAQFAPTVAGIASGGITITSNASTDPTVMVALSGTGTQASASANPTSAGLGSVVVGSNNSQSIMLSNTGTATLTFSNISVTGAGFSITGLNTLTTVAAKSSVTFNAVFTPAAATGLVNGSIVLTTNGLPAQVTIPLSGTGVAATDQLGDSPASLNFNSVSTGASSQMTTTLTNTGNANVTISGVTVAGAGFSASGVTNGLTLQPNQTATLTVTFAPATAGAVSGAKVTVNSNATSLVIPLSGTGTAVASQSVSLAWTASSTSDVVGYYAYRSTTLGSGYVKLNPSSPVSSTQYSDSTVQSATTYYYIVTAVDSSDVESAYSSPATAVIP